MKHYGSAEELLKVLGTPKALEAMKAASRIRGQLLPYQAAALYTLARAYNFAGASILEIGTLAGYSAAVMAMAAPEAYLITLNPAEHEVKDAIRNLVPWPNVRVIQAASWDYLDASPNAAFDLVFVDGDHKRVRQDIPWWERVRPGGLMLFHDYSPVVCAPVYEAVNELAGRLGKAQPDVVIMDDDKIGMAGIYKSRE